MAVYLLIFAKNMPGSARTITDLLDPSTSSCHNTSLNHTYSLTSPMAYKPSIVLSRLFRGAVLIATISCQYIISGL